MQSSANIDLDFSKHKRKVSNNKKLIAPGLYYCTIITTVNSVHSKNCVCQQKPAVFMIVYWPSKLILISYSHTAPTFAVGVEEFFFINSSRVDRFSDWVKFKCDWINFQSSWLHFFVIFWWFFKLAQNWERNEVVYFLSYMTIKMA